MMADPRTFNNGYDSAFGNAQGAPGVAMTAAPSGAVVNVAPAAVNGVVDESEIVAPSLSFGSRTDIGYVRKQNEDSLLVSPPLFVVCDGMGGHEAGEIASEIAIQTIGARAPKDLDAEQLGQAVTEANLAIIQATREGISREGMGTTCTAAMLDGTHLILAQAGDSRAYLLHNGSLQQLTRDHSLVADLVESGEIDRSEARTHPWRSYITRALGLDPYMQPDLYELSIASGDRLMLCSDGLYSMVDDSVIAEILASNAHPQDAADELVEEALINGGADNITVIVVDAFGSSSKRARKLVRKAKRTAVIIVALMVLLIAGAAIGLNAWMSNSAYLGDVDGKVAIYKGIPEDFLGMHFAQLQEVTDIAVDDLQPGIAARIKDGGVRCDSVEAAHRLVSGYELEIRQKTGVPSGIDPASEGAGNATDAAGAAAGTQDGQSGQDGQGGADASSGAASHD